ncbi:hypothetical protein FAVG1_00192 [Fusarium avenaceum]|nr:hypothetical protein FAVG1_00192 [Fusarium avenaceum]
MSQPSDSESGSNRKTIADWLHHIRGLDFNHFTPTPMQPSVYTACETTILWRRWTNRGNHTEVLDTRMRMVLETCLEEFYQHEEEAEGFMNGLFLEDNPVANSQHEEKFYQRVALRLGASWNRVVDLDHLRALVMYVIFARVHFLLANRQRSLMVLLQAEQVVVYDAHVLLCRFLLYKDRNLAAEKRRQLVASEQISAESWDDE